jgi:hypothetical protein
MVTTLNAAAGHNESQANYASLTTYLSRDLDIYFCLHCRLYFPSESNFSHNCWNDNSGAGGVKNPSLSYFSPIYLKFNVNMFLMNSKGGTASKHTAATVNNTTITGNVAAASANASVNGRPLVINGHMPIPRMPSIITMARPGHSLPGQPGSSGQ